MIIPAPVFTIIRETESIPGLTSFLNNTPDIVTALSSIKIFLQASPLTTSSSCLQIFVLSVFSHVHSSFAEKQVFLSQTAKQKIIRYQIPVNSYNWD